MIWRTLESVLDFNFRSGKPRHSKGVWNLELSKSIFHGMYLIIFWRGKKKVKVYLRSVYKVVEDKFEYPKLKLKSKTDSIIQ